MALIECVPNISEGRRADVVAEGAAAIRASGSALLDMSRDAAHHRAVYTFAGEAAAVESGALALAHHAVRRIDLRLHEGVHPRIGAIDVLPFVPLSGARMTDAVASARRVGAEIARRFDLPVFLYGEAASTSARRALEDVRRREFEGLAARMLAPDGAPDFGPRRPHPSAGAVAVGARPILIAFNANLTTGDVTIARRIAAAVRERDGGLPSVKAMGVLVEGGAVAQVSMNLTNYEVTSPLRAFHAVAEEAARNGVRIRDSELVGLMPEAAMPPEGPGALALRDFLPRQFLEYQLRQHGLVDA